jgi:hypothetical protein
MLWATSNEEGRNLNGMSRSSTKPHSAFQEL